ncbi:hypothetical protein KIN20_034814 [Parelaphostrongylus tenuis]|uniref:G-protein coupled receptors family 1 profile domain-containing protein n=1 Tax=Parelaphostrongylus tenuis TaxID=148309 RepID=A0AAD5WK08_PARTN|nr:hypothetical protein KIN20_034814 [Parelaphostrongylus tenuis]
MYICYLTNERKFRSLALRAWRSFYVELCLLGLVVFNTILLTVLLFKTKRSLSTATVLFVFNIMFSNLLFFCSFVFFMRDLFNDKSYGSVNEDYLDKSPELVTAETLQTHLFASDEFRKHLIQETLYSLAQNGSLTGLIHLLVLVLLVINRSMSGKTIHLSRVSVISVFSCVWIFLILSHLLFSTLQISAIQNLDELFSTLSKGKTYLQCEQTIRSDYAEIASQCDRTAVFHAFGAYLLRGHTLFTLFFLSASIVIFTITVAYHCRVRRQNFLQSAIRDQSPHRRREKLFHTLIFSIATFFLSVLGQTYIEIAVFWVNDREEVATLTKWYHFARIAAFVDPVLNPLIVVARTPALRRQLRTQWTSIRTYTSSYKTKSRRSGSVHGSMKRKASRHERPCDVEVKLIKPNRPVGFLNDDRTLSYFINPKHRSRRILPYSAHQCLY